MDALGETDQPRRNGSRFERNGSGSKWPRRKGSGGPITAEVIFEAIYWSN